MLQTLNRHQKQFLWRCTHNLLFCFKLKTGFMCIFVTICVFSLKTTTSMSLRAWGIWRQSCLAPDVQEEVLMMAVFPQQHRIVHKTQNTWMKQFYLRYKMTGKSMQRVPTSYYDVLSMTHMSNSTHLYSLVVKSLTWSHVFRVFTGHRVKLEWNKEVINKLML